MTMTVIFIRYPHVDPDATDGALRPKKWIHLTARKRMVEARLLHKTLQITAIKGLRQNEPHAALLFPQLRQSGAQTGCAGTQRHAGDQDGSGGGMDVT